ncbi:hypothetical protein Tco_1318329 [Tanacetum coccineum]
MNERCSAVLLNELPSKEKDPRNFTIPCQVLEKHKEAEDLAADHLSRFESPHMEVLTEKEIVDKFSNEHLIVLKSKFKDDEPWYADFVNYIVGKVVPPNWTFEKRKRFFSQVKTYFWEEPYAFKLCADNIMRRCVAGSETLKILAHCHSGPTGGHHSANITAKKVYESGLSLRMLMSTQWATIEEILWRVDIDKEDVEGYRLENDATIDSCMGVYLKDSHIKKVLDRRQPGTVLGEPPYPFNYPTRRLTMKEMLAKFIDEGRRKHEEMEIFIKEFRTTNELLLKTRSNLLSELKIELAWEELIDLTSLSFDKLELVDCFVYPVLSKGIVLDVMWYVVQLALGGLTMGWLQSINIKLRGRNSVKGQILADFLAETPSAESKENEAKETTDKKEEPENMWKLYTDGASSFDGSGAGLMLVSLEGKEYTYALIFEFNTTNNEA